MVTHLFISLFIKFAANIFTIMLFCGLFAKCIVCQARFKCSLSWKRVCTGNPGRGEGRAGKQLQKHYIIDIFVNDPFFVIKLPKADGEMKTEKAS